MIFYVLLQPVKCVQIWGCYNELPQSEQIINISRGTSCHVGQSVARALVDCVRRGMYLLRVIAGYLLPNGNLHLTANDEEESDIDDLWSQLRSFIFISCIPIVTC